VSRAGRAEPFGLRAERLAARGHTNARRAIASGRLSHDPGDYHIGRFLFEHKGTEEVAISLRREWLTKIAKEALPIARTPALELRFCTEDGRARSDAEWIGVQAHTSAELIEHQGDGPDSLIENRATHHKSTSIRLDWLRGLKAKASAQDMAPAFHVQFCSDSMQPDRFGDWMFIEKHQWKELTRVSGDCEASEAPHVCRSNT
jgi:hypothetical protein